MIRFQNGQIFAHMLLACACGMVSTALAENETSPQEPESGQTQAKAAFSLDEIALLAINEFRSSFTECAETTSGNTWKIIDCINSEFRYQDVRLNKSYQKLMSQHSGKFRLQLRHNQRNWISQKNADCRFDPETGGQGQLIESESCKLNMTAVKAKELEDMVTAIK